VVENEWIVCPDCHTQLKRTCLNCGQSLHLRWNICPYCGTGVHQSGLGAQPIHLHPDTSAPQAETKPVEVIELDEPEAS